MCSYIHTHRLKTPRRQPHSSPPCRCKPSTPTARLWGTFLYSSQLFDLLPTQKNELMEKNDRISSFGSTASKRREEPRPCLDTTSHSDRTFCGNFSVDSPASYLRLRYPHRSKGSQKGQKVPERVGGRKTNKDSQLDLCPKACIVAPALLFVPERVKP